MIFPKYRCKLRGADPNHRLVRRATLGLVGFSILHVVCLTWVGSSAYAAEEDDLLSNTRQLTFEGRRAGEGYFSADGTRMIFQSERDAANPFYQIYLMDLDTGDVDRVSPGYGKTTCAWIHPDMDKVLFASTHEDPEARQKMQAELDFRASGKQRRYSWDYDEQYEIYEQHLGTAERRNLTNSPGYDAEGAYSPDGSQIVFASNRRAFTDEMSAEEAAAFQHDKSFIMDLYLMNADGSGVRRLTDAPGYDGGPFFSFDGRKITWRRFSMDGSRAEIYTMDLDSGEEKQLTKSPITGRSAERRGKSPVNTCALTLEPFPPMDRMKPSKA